MTNPTDGSARSAIGADGGGGVPRIRVLGGLALEGAAGPPPGRLPLAVLARLVAEHPSTVGRQRLAAFLWPDHPPRRGRHRLSDSLYMLRGVLGEEVLISQGDEVGLDPARVTCDLWDFDAALREGRPGIAVDLHGGPFVEGFLPGDGGEFEAWADLERSRIRRRFRGALEALALEGEQGGGPHEAARWWSRLVEEDPVHEVAVLRLMQALDAAGERGEALRWAERHVRAMQEEFEAEPDPGIVALAERLREVPAVRGGVEGVWRAREMSEGKEPRGPDRATQAREAAPWAAEPGGPLDPAPHDSGNRGSREDGDATGRRGRRAVSLVLAGGGMAVLLGFLVVVPALRSPGPAPADARVLVLPLANRTGDPGLDPLGDVAADRIILALSRAGTRVAPLEEGIRVAAETGSGGTAGGGDGPEGPAPGSPGSRGGATSGADLRVEGALHASGDSLRFQVTVTDLRRRVVVAAVGPTTASAADPLPVLDDLARRTVAVLALQGDSTPVARALLAGRPPRIEAYRAYV